MKLLIGIVVVFALVPVSPALGQGARDELVLYQAPIDTWVEDPFRPPAHIGAPGNRGLQYGSSEGHGVRAAADGRVAFAGRVGHRLIVSIDHADGVRTTYTGLGRIQVEQGQPVEAREIIGVAIARFHFGARLGDHYLDPQVLLDASQPQNVPRLIAPD